MARMVKGCDRVWNVSLLCRTMGAPGRGCEAGGPAEGGRGGGVMGYLQSLVGNCPGIPHWDCPAIWQPIPREEDEGDCCSLPSLPAITSRPTQGGRGSYMCVCAANPSRVETES